MRRPFAYPCGGIHRRQFLAATKFLPILSAVHVSGSEFRAAGPPAKPGVWPAGSLSRGRDRGPQPPDDPGRG